MEGLKGPAVLFSTVPLVLMGTPTRDPRATCQKHRGARAMASPEVCPKSPSNADANALEESRQQAA